MSVVIDEGLLDNGIYNSNTMGNPPPPTLGEL